MIIQSALNRHLIAVLSELVIEYAPPWPTFCNLHPKTRLVDDTGFSIQTPTDVSSTTCFAITDRPLSSTGVVSFDIKLDQIVPLKNSSGPLFSIGVACSTTDDRFYELALLDHGWSFWSIGLSEGGNLGRYGFGELRAGDLIRTEINHSAKTIRFYRNGTDCGVAFDSRMIHWPPNGIFYPMIWLISGSMTLVDVIG